MFFPYAFPNTCEKESVHDKSAREAANQAWFLQDIEKLAETLIEKSGGKLRIAFNEANDSCAHDPEAQRHLKLNEHRLGRDFKVYNFMGRIEGYPAALCNLLGEVVLPLQFETPDAFVAGLDYLEGKGDAFGDNKDGWIEMVRSYRPKMG